MTAKELRAAQEALQMTGEQLAAYLGVTGGAVSRWLSGKRPIPGPVAKLINMAVQQGGK